MKGTKRARFLSLLGLIVVLSMALASCATPAAPPAAPTQAPEPTAVPPAAAPQATAVPPKAAPAATAVPPTEAPKATEAAKPAAGGGGTLVVGLPSGFDRLDPNVTTFSRVGNMTLHMTDPLVWQKEPGVFVPGLATEWKVNADATEYRFKLREDVKFHDGTPFNAQAVKYTFDRIVNPETKSQSALSAIGPYKETEVVNDHEVIVRFKTGFAPFLDSLSGATLVPISPTAQKRVGNEDWGIKEFVGTGPYKFESVVQDQEIVMVKNPDYNWGPEWVGRTGPANFDKIIFKFIGEGATRTAALETGEIQFEDDVPTEDFKTLAANKDMKTENMPQPGSGWALMFNHELFPTSELPVRRAMQLALDRQGYIDTVLNGFGNPACSPLTSSVACYDKSMCAVYPTDLEKAKQVLEDAGWKDTNGDGIREKDGKPLTIGHYFRADSPTGPAEGAFLKDNMAKIGIDVQLNGLARSGYFDAVRAGKHNTQGWWETGTDPDVVRVLFHSSNAHGGTNRNNYINPEMDKLIDDAAAEPDMVKRCQLYSTLQQKVKDEAIMEFWADPSILYAHSAKLDGITLYLGGNTPYFYNASLTK